MAKYIEEKELMEWVENWFEKNRYYHPYSKTNDIPIPELYDILEQIPTADVVERKHGRWLPYEFGSKRWHKCSVCGKADEYINERGIEAVRKFCPNCGAEMRE